MSVTGGISPTQLATYRITAQRKKKEHERSIKRREQNAWVIARQAAQFLKDEYGANQVILYGSLARGEGFHTRSDIDLAAWGIEEKQYYRTVSRLLDIAPTIEVNLVMGEFASPLLLENIEKEGVAL